MSRNVRLTFAGLALFFVLFPLTLQKPGLPLDLKSDEPAYYLMALSLVQDGDLRCELKDIQRLATEYPYNETKNLILMTDDGWNTVYFGKPYLVSLLAAPAVALFGANGFVGMNMALLLLSVWMGALYLRQWNADGPALFYSAGFFLLSNAFAYVFWLHTEVLCIAAVTATLYLAFTPAPVAVAGSRAKRLLALVWNERTRPAWSGAALVFAAYNKPVLALLGLPAFVLAFRQQRLRGAASWLAGALLSGILVCGIAVALTGHPSAYLGVERSGVRVLDAQSMPELPVARSAAYPEKIEEQIGPRNSWGWIFRMPEIDHRLPGNLLYFFVGRHTGLFLYAPFTLLSILLFLAYGRASSERWILALATAGVAFFFLTFIPFNWHGGGGFIGNRYFVNALPALLFLVTRIAPAWIPVAGYALGGLFVAPILFTPFGAVVPQPTLQAHVRNAPFKYFPFEESLTRQIPGYRGQIGNGIYFFGRKDVVSSVGDSLWIEGGRPVEIWVSSDVRLERPVFQIETPVAPNRISIELGDDRKETRFDSAEPPGNVTRVTLVPGEPRHRRADDGTAYFSYKLWVQAAAQTFRTERIPAKPPTEEEALELAQPGARPRPEFEEATFLVGAMVTYLGEESSLDADAYHLEWVDAKPPPAWHAHRLVRSSVTIRNASQATWAARGSTRVALAYRWYAGDGTTLVAEGLRTPLPRDLAPGETATLAMEIATPRSPGSYVLEIDALRERLAWFDSRSPGTARRFPIDVAPADGD
ncbi:MAG: hypothetical protein R2862_02185 [Thermoanaerobaculia bacterium]